MLKDAEINRCPICGGKPTLNILARLDDLGEVEPYAIQMGCADCDLFVRRQDAETPEERAAAPVEIAQRWNELTKRLNAWKGGRP